jgi:hypothetical protein
MEIANQDLVKVLSRANECVRRLIEAGLTFEDLQIPIDDPEKRKKIVDFWKSQTPEKRIPKVYVSKDSVLDSFKSLDSSRYSYGRESANARGSKVPEFNKLKNECCQKMLEIVMRRVERELSKKYLLTHISLFSTYEDWYNYRYKESSKEIKSLCDVIRECIYQLLQNENAIFGFPKTNLFEEKQNERLVGILKYFGYKISKSEHEPVSNVGGIIIIRHNYETKEKFVFSQVTSHYYRDPLFD